jgi:hypothetical protein
VFLPHRELDLRSFGNNTINVSWSEIMNDYMKGLMWYEHAEFVIGTRGHSQLISFGYNKPFINIASQAKNIGFMKRYKLTDYMIKSQDLFIDSFENKIKLIQDNTFGIKILINNYLNQLWSNTVDEWKIINSRTNT